MTVCRARGLRVVRAADAALARSTAARPRMSQPTCSLPPATAGVPFVSQPFEAARLAAINSFRPIQPTLDAMRQRNHSLPPGLSISVPPWAPRMVLADGLLTETEADALLEFLKTQDFNTTSVVLTNGGSKALNHTVTSRISRTYEPHDHPALALLSERIEQLSFLPSTWAEGLSALRYEQGDYFRAHLDVHQRPGRATHSRVATCLLYLADLVAETAARPTFRGPFRRRRPLPTARHNGVRARRIPLADLTRARMPRRRTRRRWRLTRMAARSGVRQRAKVQWDWP